MFLARDAYNIVFNVSRKLFSAGEIQAIIYVLELPPKESYRIRVNFVSLYGICLLALVVSVKAVITFPRHKSPLLILMPSFIVSPVEPVFFSDSEPAKSTK